MAVLVERDGGHERHLVLGATARLAARALTTEVGVIDLDLTTEAMCAVLPGHGATYLLVQQPGRGVAHPDLALERQSRQPGLGLADEVDREEPVCQRQFGVHHQTVSAQRGLMPTAIALEKLACTVLTLLPAYFAASVNHTSAKRSISL